MTKTELTAMVARNACINHREANDAINAIMQCISAALQKGERVTLPGFASFSTTTRKARNSTNPRTGQPITIPARRAPTARFSDTFKSEL